jgi:hypothetical protein
MNWQRPGTEEAGGVAEVIGKTGVGEGMVVPTIPITLMIDRADDNLTRHHRYPELQII